MHLSETPNRVEQRSGYESVSQILKFNSDSSDHRMSWK